MRCQNLSVFFSFRNALLVRSGKQYRLRIVSPFEAIPHSLAPNIKFIYTFLVIACVFILELSYFTCGVFFRCCHYSVTIDQRIHHNNGTGFAQYIREKKYYEYTLRNRQLQGV